MPHALQSFFPVQTQHIILENGTGHKRPKKMGETGMGPGQHRGSYEITACTVNFLAHSQWAGSREGNGGTPIGEPPPGGEDDDLPPF
jgi:hypothetical protein